MSTYFFDKHYEGEKYIDLRVSRKIVSVRLSDEEINIVKQMYPNRKISYGIRSLIHKHASIFD